MSANVFEIIVRRGFEPYDVETLIELQNGDFNDFTLNGVNGQYTPNLFGFEGLTNIATIDESEDVLPDFFNDDFTEDWNTDYQSQNGADVYGSFFEPTGWDVQMFSIANHGRSQDNSQDCEVDTAPAYSYYNGNANRLLPNLFLNSRRTAGSTYQRMAGSDDFEHVPDVTTSTAGSGLDTTAFSWRESSYDFGSYQGINQLGSDSNQYSITTANAGADRLFRINFQDTLKMKFHMAWGYNLQYGVSTSDWYYNNIAYTHKWNWESNYSEAQRTVFPAPFLRFRDVFNVDTDLNQKVAIKVGLTVDATASSQVLTGCFVDGSGTDCDASAIDYDINASTGFISSTSNGTFHPAFSYLETIDGALQYSDYSEQLSINANRLQIKKVIGQAFHTVIVADVNLDPKTDYRIYFDVSSAYISPSIRVDIKTDATTPVTIMSSAMSGNSNLTTTDNVGFDFRTSTATAYQLVLTNTGGQESSMSFNSINFKRNILDIYETDNYSQSGYSKFSSENDIILTTSSFINDPDVNGGQVEAEHWITSKYYDTNNNVQTANSDNFYASPNGLPISDSVYCNFNAVGSNGTPLLNEAQTIRFKPKTQCPKDAAGFFTGAPFFVEGVLDIGSPHLNCIVDNLTGNYPMTATLLVDSVEFGTCENSHITRDSAGGDKLHLKYDPSATITPPPIATMHTEIPQPLITAGETLTVGWKVDTLTGDDLMIDLGGSNTIAVTSTGVGSATIVADGSRLRLRSETAEEKGSALAGIEAVVDYVSISVTVTGTQLLTNKWGDETSNNDGVGGGITAYDAALRVYSIDAGTQALTNSLGGVVMSKTLSNVANCPELLIKINIIDLGTNNSVVVTDYLSNPDGQETTITTTGETIITRANTLDVETSVLSMAFLSDGSNPLDVKMTSIALQRNDLVDNSTVTTIDLYDDFELPINLSIKDFTDLDTTSGDYSKTISVPATKNNKDAINFNGELNALISDDYFLGTECLIKSGGLEVFNGHLHLAETQLDEFGETELSFNIKGGNSSWADTLKNMPLRNLSSPEYLLSKDALYMYAFTDSSAQAIQFPLIDNGQWAVFSQESPSQTALGWDNLKAAYKIKYVFDKIWSKFGYSIESEFLNGVDWSSDFSSEMGGLFQNLVGIAPAMQVSDEVIIQSELDISATETQHSTFFSQSVTTPRPRLRSEMHNSSLNNPDYKYHCDWSFLKFDTENVDRSNIHSTATISGALEDCGFEYNSSGGFAGGTALKNQSGDSNTLYSVIRVSKSGYYDINTSIAGDFEGNESAWGYPYYAGTPREHKFSVILTPQDMALDALYKNTSSMGAELFDLYDESWVGLNDEDYDTTRISLNRTQYLRANTHYNVLAISGTKLGVSWESGADGDAYFTTKFKLTEVDLNIKRHKDVAPMRGKNSVVYTDEATPKVSLAEVLPDVSALDFISDITKMFNLCWSTNPATKVITVEPYQDFFDLQGETYGYLDWTDKALITNIKEKGVLKSDLAYKMSDDSNDSTLDQHSVGDYNLKRGDKRVPTAGIESSKEKSIELGIFSALSMGMDNFLIRDVSAAVENQNFYPTWMPRIWGRTSSTLEPELNEQKAAPNDSHGHKLAVITGNETITDGAFIYHLKRFWNHTQEQFQFLNESTNSYMKVESYSPHDSSIPNLTFSDALGSTNEDGGLYNTYHQPLIEMLGMRDKLITAQVNLTAGDINNVNFRQLVNIDNNLYIINKIKDFNFSGESTEVELLLATPRGIKEKIK